MSGKEISKKDVDDIAALACLELTEAEGERMRDDLSKVLDYVEVLDELDLDEIESTSRVTPLPAEARADAVGECLPVDAALASAPVSEDGFFKVPARSRS